MVSPNYVLGENTVPIPPGLAGQLFCRVIYRGFFVWLFSKFSVLLVTCMAIERWFAIAKPTRYVSGKCLIKFKVLRKCDRQATDSKLKVCSYNNFIKAVFKIAN